MVVRYTETFIAFN